jgi:cell division protein FtsB
VGPLLQALLHSLTRRAGYVLAILLIAGYGWVFLSGPQGLQALLEKRKEIHELQDRNEEMKRENERRKERIHRLQESRSEQEMEIRRQLKLLRPGETTFILPENPKDKSPATPQ